nr:MarR family transcriptional regulator [Neglectibacter timonensis]
MISQIKSVSGRLFERILQDCGVEEFNGAQGRILYVLWQADRVPIVELSQKTGLAKNTLTSMLGRMEESGLILREQSEEDRRQTIISLTDKARELEEKYDEVSERANLLFFKGFTPAEIAELECLLSKVLVNLERSENDLKRGKDVTKWLK